MYLNISKYTLVTAIAVVFSAFQLQAQSNTSNPDKLSKAEKRAERNLKINELIKQEEDGALIYERQNIYGFKLNSDGWGVFFEKGFLKTVNKTNLFSFEFGERKHPKEEKLFNLSGGGGGFFFTQPLIYGKQNNFYYAKLGVGQSYLIGGKGNRNGVAVSAIYGGGLSLGLLKPYYVDAADPLTFEIIEIKYEGGDGTYDDLFLDGPQGSSGMFKGINETKITPGLYTKAGLRFDYGRYNEMISAIEVGFNLEYYTGKMPVLIFSEERNTFFNVFVAIEFGRRK